MQTSRIHAWGLLAATSLFACTVVSRPAGQVAPNALPPAGYGTLRQADVSVSLESGRLQILVTPLAESVIRVTAPDTYRRLSELAARYGPEAARRGASVEPHLFLVSLFSETPDVSFIPEDLRLTSRGMRLRPATVLPVTPGWGTRRLNQREPESAIYAFNGEVDLASDLVVEYAGVESAAWAVIWPRIQAETAKVRARSPGGGTRDQASSP